jgi:hypothetical protein
MRGSGRRPERSVLKRKPRMVRGFMRIAAGASILYLTTGTNRPVKLQRDDVRILETDAGKYVEEMQIDELEQAMQKHSIEQVSLTDDEKQIARLASKYVLAGYFVIRNDESTS